MFHLTYKGHDYVVTRIREFRPGDKSSRVIELTDPLTCESTRIPYEKVLEEQIREVEGKGGSIADASRQRFTARPRAFLTELRKQRDLLRFTRRKKESNPDKPKSERRKGSAAGRVAKPIRPPSASDLMHLPAAVREQILRTLKGTN